MCRKSVRSGLRLERFSKANEEWNKQEDGVGEGIPFTYQKLFFPFFFPVNIIQQLQIN